MQRLPSRFCGHALVPQRSNEWEGVEWDQLASEIRNRQSINTISASLAELLRQRQQGIGRPVREQTVNTIVICHSRLLLSELKQAFCLFCN